MATAARLVRGEQQKQIVKLIEEMAGRMSAWEIWQDFIVPSALAISNSVDREYREQREQEYMKRASRYTREEMQRFPEMLALVVSALEENQDQDFLGDLFMCLGLGDQWKGQFFTPYCVCKAMAKLNSNEQMEQWEMGIYEDAIETWGRQAQMMKAAEELCELAAAINRLLCCEESGYRTREDVLAELMGEWADVEIMLNQLHVMIEMDEEVYIGKLEALQEKIRKAREAHADK